MRGAYRCCLWPALAMMAVACEQVPDENTTVASATNNVCREFEGFAAYACARPEWQQRDNDINRVLARLQSGVSHSAKQDLRIGQRQWERVRDVCLQGPLPDREICLEARYAERMLELQAMNL